jgi:hypothetical protein
MLRATIGGKMKKSLVFGALALTLMLSACSSSKIQIAASPNPSAKPVCTVYKEVAQSLETTYKGKADDLGDTMSASIATIGISMAAIDTPTSAADTSVSGQLTWALLVAGTCVKPETLSYIRQLETSAEQEGK